MTARCRSPSARRDAERRKRLRLVEEPLQVAEVVARVAVEALQSKSLMLGMTGMWRSSLSRHGNMP